MSLILHLCMVIGAGPILVSSEQCSHPLGMESGLITNAQLSASSSYEINSVGPYQARLNNNKGGGAWCPKSFISEATGTNEFLEIDLGEENRISGVVTQGRYASGLGQEYAEMFLIQYWHPGMPDFEGYKDASGVDLFTGNSDTYTEVETILNPPVKASRIRIIPYSRHPRTVCMRVELVGCKGDSTDVMPGLSSSTSSPAFQPPHHTLTTNSDSEKYHLVEQQPDTDVDQQVNKKLRETANMVEVDLNQAGVIQDHEVVVLEPWWQTEYMGVAVGILVTVILVLITIIVFILYKNYKTGAYPDGLSVSGSHYYETRIPKFDHPESQWPECRKLTMGRKLPPTPTTSEEHYTDSSAEYSSPLLTQQNLCNGSNAGVVSGRHYQTSAYMSAAKQMHPDWETFFPSPPPPGTPPRLTVPRAAYMKPVSHYAASDIIKSGGSISSGSSKVYGKGGTTYFL